MLQTDSPMPYVSLEDTSGRPVRLTDYRGTRNVLMYFMRSTTCPVCNNHIRDLASRATELAAHGVTVIVAVPEGRAEAAHWQTKKNVPFTVVTGQQGTAHQAVGLTKKIFGAMQQSGSILIDADGVIRHAHAATMPTASYDKKGILAALDSLPAPRRE